MEKHLLFPTSAPIEHNNLISEIHQSIIDLQWDPPENEIQTLIKDSLEFLDKNLDEETTKEILYFIIECFSHIKDQNNFFLNEMFEDSKKNSNRLILFSLICSQYEKGLNDPQIKSLISDISKQLLKYIKSNNKNLTIFSHKISQRFKNNFIYNIISRVKASEKVVSIFYSFLLTQTSISEEKSDTLFQKAIGQNLITSFSEDVLSDDRYFKHFSFENVISMLNNVTAKNFTKILTMIQTTFPKKESWTTQYLMALFDKCVDFDIDFSFIQSDFFFELFDKTQMKSRYWKYFSWNDISLPNDFISGIDMFPDPKEAIFLLKDYKNVPIDILAKGLLEIDDISFYERLLDYDFSDKESIIVSDKNFWIHIFICFSSSNEKYKKPLYKPFVEMFEQFVQIEKAYEYIEAMIFTLFPTTETGNQFLLDFLSNLSFQYREEFNQNRLILLTLVSDMKVFPLPSFWDIFDREFMEQLFEDEVELNDPVISYAYYFINFKSQFKTIENFLIQPFTEEKSVIEFIKRNDLNYMINMNTDSLSLIMAALIYALQEIKPEIIGLTKFTILPFLAISLNFLSSEKNCDNLQLTEEMKDLLIKASKFLAVADKAIMNVSVNSILSHFEYLLNAFEDTALEMLGIFKDQLIDDSYTADEGILLRTIFNLQNLYATKEKVQVFFDKYGFNLIEQILKIDDFSQLNDVKFDLEIFDVEKVSSTLIKKIQDNSSYNEVINSIHIILNSNVDFPDLEKIVKKMDMNKLFQRATFKKKNNDLTTISEFKYMYNIPNISYDLYSKFNKNANNINLDSFISKLVSNKDYFETLFEKICIDFIVQPKIILEKYFDIYNKNPKSFLQSLSSSFAFNSSRKVFVKLPNSPTKLDAGLNFKYLLLSNLLEGSNNVDTFLLVYKLLSIFPFILEDKEIERFFDSILPALDNFDLYFTINNKSNKNDVNSLKVSISAFHCLYISLYSPKILDSFFPWLFKRSLHFTHSQSFTMMYILLSLLSTMNVKDGMLAFSSKFDFFKILDHLNKTQVPPEISSYFKENTFRLTNLYFNEILSLDQFQNAYINGLKENTPFQSIFDHFHTIYPTKLAPLQLPKVKNNEIKEFIEFFNTPSSFSIHYDHPSIEISEKQVNDFIDHFKKINGYTYAKFRDKSYTYRSYYDYSSEMKCCSSEFDHWVFRSFFELGFNIPQTEAHTGILDKAKEKIDRCYQDNYRSYYNFKNYFKNYEFIYNMIYDPRYTPIVTKIIQTFNGIDLFINILNARGYNLENYKIIKEHFVSIINNYHEYNISLISALISFSLLPEMRKDIQFLTMTSKFICKFKLKEVPKQFDFFICLLFGINSDEINSTFFLLIDKLNNLKLMPILEQLIKHFYEQEMAKKDPSIMKIARLICAFPELLKNCRINIPILIDAFLTSYHSGISNESNSIRVIYKLFNEITPDRTEEQVYNINEENPSIDFSESMYHNPNDDKFGLSEVPTHFVNSNPTFWNLYIKHRKTLNIIVSESSGIYSKFKFLKEYPELMSFDNRINLFRKSILKIKQYNCIYINVSRSRVLADSFEQLSEISREEWLTPFNVHFRDESGVDAGGLTKDWFSLIAKEIFNPDFALFTLTENQTYQPNLFSGINPQHIEYFNFIGKVIARSLIQRQYVKCHFSRSFIRQILQVPLKLKDLEDYDTNVYNSMRLILEGDAEPLCLTFTIDVDDFGQMKTIFLKENGDEIDVTNNNKKEYVTLYTNYKLRKSIIKQINAFCEGFYFLIPHEKIKLFSPSELDLMICGIPDIDIDDLRKNMNYEEPYHDDHPVINMFFNAISKWSRDDLAKLLLFVTGSSQVPIGGFKEYRDKGKAITISGGGGNERLCVAHTCFNTLDLPLYQSEEELNRKLLMSIQELEFGIA